MNIVGNANGTGNTCDSYFYGTININIIGGTVTGNIYGAGAGGVTGYSENSSDPYKSYGKDFNTKVNINISNGTINGDIFGGGYGYTEYLNANVTAADGGALYGDSDIKISGTPVINGNIYGAGCGYDYSRKQNIAQMTGNSNIEINGTPTIHGTIYGAGAGISGYSEMAKLIGQSNIILKTNSNFEIYGGGNIAKLEGESKVNINSGTHTADIYGGGNIGVLEGTANVYINGGTQEKVYGGGNKATVTTTKVYIQGGINSDVFGGGNEAEVTTTNVYVNDGNSSHIYGGGNKAAANETNIFLQEGQVDNVFGGSNSSGDVEKSNIIANENGNINAVNIYGGNNLGGVTNNPNIEINSGTIENIYGGGNQATVPTTNIKINDGNIQNIYGGGNQATVERKTNVEILGGVIGNNVYGGGNEGTVTGDTNVNVKDAIILGSAYAGGNGATAICYGNANIIIQGDTIIGSENEGISTQAETGTDEGEEEEEITIPLPKGSVFGGGNAAATGDEETNNSTSTVSIVGGTIYGNVYGGANTSVVYGYTKVNIGYEAVKNDELQKGDIYIKGTVFGGGEANAKGEKEYDFSFISVTKGIEMLLDGTGHTSYKTEGSIFGSGNASSTSGTSNIVIKNYGKIDEPMKNISIQRATTVTIDNSSIVLTGIKDRTNEWANEKFTFSRIDELILSNNSNLYLNYGANVVKVFTSQDADGNIATVTIDEDGTTVKNVDNRIYLLEGKTLNVAINETPTLFGDVNGMTFLGIYTNANNPSTSTGLYHHGFENGDEITNAGTFSNNGKVEGLHKVSHNIKIDGFYTNYNNEGYIKAGYIVPTPEEGASYIWNVGEVMDVVTIEFSLVASKYATIGTVEKPLSGFTTPNTVFQIVGFSSGLNDDITLVQGSEIDAIATDEKTANTVFGLSMKTGKTGWQANNTTNFLTANGGSYEGASLYQGDNSTLGTTLIFCFYHSQNLTEAKELGNVRIRLQAIEPTDGPYKDISYIDIVINMSTILMPKEFYETSISPGEEFELFTTTDTKITEDSIFSTYYSLYIGNFSKNDIYEGYTTYNRALISRNSVDEPYVFPKNTRLTMLDMASNKYYYYVVTDDDEKNGKYIYKLKDFTEMGTKNSKYDEVAACGLYYNTEQNLIYENFIFHIDVSEANFTENAIDNSLLIELQDTDNQTLVGVLGEQRGPTRYSIYKDMQATIDVVATAPSKIYLGQDIDLTVTTDFLQQNLSNASTVYDTDYLTSKMGIKITIHDSYGNQLKNDSLLGIYFQYEGRNYYPRIDGSVRIKIADKVSNVLSKIKIVTNNNTVLPTGDYTIKVESFGSPDGIYYGLETSDSTELDIRIINGIYGLKVTTDDASKIIDKTTGNTLKNNNALITTVEYSSLLASPNIVVELQRRNYDETYSMQYEIVDFEEYFSNAYKDGHKQNEYLIIEKPLETHTLYLYFRENLKTGTYKIIFKLYDGDTFIGEAYEYFVIK